MRKSGKALKREFMNTRERIVSSTDQIRSRLLVMSTNSIHESSSIK